ncbi:MAG: sigma 54-interacting transcriptional regulator [bacterium]
MPGSLDGPTEIILESISDGVFTVDGDWRITSFNRAAEEITGIPRAEAIGRHCSEVFKSSMCEGDCALGQTMETAVPMINKQAFIVDVRGRRIPISVSTALLRSAQGKVIGGAETFRDLSLVEELRKELFGRFQVGDMISRSAAMRKIFDVLPQLAASDSTVLIQGETGTGKELLARAIQALGPRRDKPFVAVNCGALPDTLLESELFGYKAGAFTGAARDKPGRFALAEHGILFLDEIGEVSPALQVRLLRVLQDKTYEPLGGTKSIAADVRIIAATNRDLATLVRKGAFRQDLFYRINVIRIDLPPLRRRREDVPLLIDHFVARFNRLQGRTVSGVSPEVLAFLTAHDYPGNVRELENLIERAFVLCDGDCIEVRHLPEDFVPPAPAPALRGSGRLRTTVKTIESQAIREALRRNRNNRLAAARDLGMHKSTLFRKMRALGMALPDQDGRSGMKRAK